MQRKTDNDDNDSPGEYKIHQEGEEAKEKNSSKDDSEQVESKRMMMQRRRMRVEKNPFAPRTSYLDPSASESALQLSEFRGFFNLVAMMAAFYIFCTNASFFLRHGTLVGLRTLVKLIPLDMLAPWCLLGASSFSAFFLEWAWVRWTARCRAAGRPPPSAWCRFVLQHSIQTAIFLSTLYLLVFAKDWPVVPTGTFLLHMIVLVMKMHSYLATNAEFAASAASLAEAKPSSAAGEASGDQLLPAGAPTLRRRTVPSVLLPCFVVTWRSAAAVAATCPSLAMGSDMSRRK